MRRGKLGNRTHHGCRAARVEAEFLRRWCCPQRRLECRGHEPARSAAAVFCGENRLNPELFEARSLLVRCYLHSHLPEKADAEFRTLLRFYPASREVWQQWYEQQKRARPGDVGPVSKGHSAR